MSTVAIIGGTGLEALPPEFHVESLTIETPFGPAAASRATRGEDGGSIVFLSRHGAEHGLAPHQVNYRANTAALLQLGVTRVLATNAVGSLRLDVTPGSLVLLDDFIDFTRNRPVSFWQDNPNAPAGVVHTDFSQPYCAALRAALVVAAAQVGVPLLPRGTYVCAEGPRFESPAEIRMFAQWGGDVVGMTGLPEAVFAREAGLCYAAVAIVTNFGAGLTETPVAHEDVLAAMAESIAQVRALLLRTAANLAQAPEAGCCGR